jgi:hypothetical protein
MAAAYPELFVSADAARMAITREAKNPEQTPIETSGLLAKNPEQMPIEEGRPSRRNPEQTPISSLLGVCSGFLRQQYRRPGARGPASTLLYGIAIYPNKSRAVAVTGGARLHLASVKSQ